jgi:uncharacterized protein with von Willebrand factor type A (vWA) domain
MVPARASRIVANLLAWTILLVVAPSCAIDRDSRRTEDVAGRIDLELASPASGDAPQLREGIAAVLLVDVSGSMDDRIARGEERKIAIARRAALDLVTQFDAYADAHPGEPVLIGLFEFSGSAAASTRDVIPLSAPDPVAAKSALARMSANGGTPIGAAMIAGKRALDQSGLSRRHLLVVTDGENTDGYAPDDVMAALGRRPEAERPSVYFVAFDISASRFNAVRDAGGLVLEAANAKELTQTLDFLLTGKILVEGP